MKLKRKEIGAQLIRFCFSGGAGVVAGYITLYVLTNFFGLWYIFSSVAANLVNGVINFFLEKFWTFRNKDENALYKQAGLYTLVRLVLFAADVGLLYLLVKYAHIYYLVAQIGITIILSLVSFVLCRKIFLSDLPQFIKSAVLIKKDNSFLLVQENSSRVHGLWNWPQGKIEAGETIEQAAIREAKEETGLNIKIEKSLGVLTDTFSDTKELHVYLGSVLGGEIDFPVNEIMDARFFTFEQIEGMRDNLVGEWIYNIISRFENS